MKATIVLEHYYGHPANRPSKEAVLKLIAKQLPDAISRIKEGDGPIYMSLWDITSITME